MALQGDGTGGMQLAIMLKQNLQVQQQSAFEYLLLEGYGLRAQLVGFQAASGLWRCVKQIVGLNGV